jgi:hypothetical protein
MPEMMRAAARLIVGCAVAAVSATAAPAQGKRTVEPAAAKIALDAARAECRKARGLRLKVRPGTITRIDLNGDGRADYLVDYNHVECVRLASLFCGTGGCPLAIVVSQRDGSYVKVFDQRVLAHKIEPGTGPRTITFQMHGTYCGGAGADDCVKTQVVTEKPFRFEQPD